MASSGCHDEDPDENDLDALLADIDAAPWAAACDARDPATIDQGFVSVTSNF